MLIFGPLSWSRHGVIFCKQRSSLVIAILTAFTPAFVLGMPSLASDTGASMIDRLTWTRLFAELSYVETPWHVLWVNRFADQGIPLNVRRSTQQLGRLLAAGFALSSSHPTGTALGRCDHINLTVPILVHSHCRLGLSHRSLGRYIISIGVVLVFAFSAARWLAMEHIQSQPSKRKSS